MPRLLKRAAPALAATAMTAAIAQANAQTAPAAATTTTVLPSPSPDVAVTLPPIEIVASPQSTPLVVVTDPKTPRQPLPASDGADYLKTIPGFTSIRSGGTN